MRGEFDSRGYRRAAVVFIAPSAICKQGVVSLQVDCLLNTRRCRNARTSRFFLLDSYFQ